MKEIKYETKAKGNEELTIEKLFNNSPFVSYSDEQNKVLANKIQGNASLFETFADYFFDDYMQKWAVKYLSHSTIIKILRCLTESKKDYRTVLAFSQHKIEGIEDIMVEAVQRGVGASTFIFSLFDNYYSAYLAAKMIEPTQGLIYALMSDRVEKYEDEFFEEFPFWANQAVKYCCKEKQVALIKHLHLNTAKHAGNNVYLNEAVEILKNGYEDCKEELSNIDAFVAEN